MIVLDTSALLAILFNEPLAPKVASFLENYEEAIVMSCVNLSETLIRLYDRFPDTAKQIESDLLKSQIVFREVTLTQSLIVARARLKYPLNLGDCFAYALAKENHAPILALDKDFAKTDAKLINIK